MGCRSSLSHAFCLHISDMCSDASAGFDSFDSFDSFSAGVFDTDTMLQLVSHNDTARCL